MIVGLDCLAVSLCVIHPTKLRNIGRGAAFKTEPTHQAARQFSLYFAYGWKSLVNNRERMNKVTPHFVITHTIKMFTFLVLCLVGTAFAEVPGRGHCPDVEVDPNFNVSKVSLIWQINSTSMGKLQYYYTWNFWLLIWNVMVKMQIFVKGATALESRK